MDATLGHTDSAVDVCIVGGGIVGLTVARLLASRCPHYSVVVLDDSDERLADREDGKSMVIDAAAAEVLSHLSALPTSSRSIKRVSVSFASVTGQHLFGDGQILGYGIDHRAVRGKLRQGLSCRPARVVSIEESATAVIVNTATGETVQARWLVVTCALSVLPPAFTTRIFDYQQTVLSLQATVEWWPENVAYQRFSYRGMSVLVPRTDGTVGVILNATPDVISGFNALLDEALSAYLSKIFDLSLQVRGRRFAYSPLLRRVRPLVTGRIVLVGTGATTLHPAGAQGLSLGIADACCLVERLATTLNSSGLATYAKRRSAHRQAALLTSGLALAEGLRTYPFRLAGGVLASFLSLSSAQKKALPLIQRLLH